MHPSALLSVTHQTAKIRSLPLTATLMRRSFVMAPAKRKNGSNSTRTRKVGSQAVKRRPRAAAAPDAITLLKTDHREVDGLFAQFEKTSGSARKHSIVKRICDALTVHATIEEEIFYPEARAALKRSGQELLDEAEVEHEGIKWRIDELKNAQPGSGHYDARVKVLGEYVRHHVKEEERKLFPQLRSTDMDMEAVGEKLAARKEALTGKPVKVEPSLIERGLQAITGQSIFPG
jgi:hemerythrin superfamily protein